jgi:hypothetical protein
MGLDAWVNCDCFEKNTLRVPPPFPEKMYIDEDGAPNMDADPYEVLESGECRGPGWEQIRAFDDWLPDACEHGDFTFLHHRIGNIGWVGHLRALVASLALDPAAEFSIVWGKVIYSGSHCGDRIEVETVPALSAEVERLERRSASVLAEKEHEHLKYFCEQMRELCEASVEVKKPICF